MKDPRLCILCGAFIDLEDQNMVVLNVGNSGKRITVKDKASGNTHVVTSRYETNKMLGRKAAEEKDDVAVQGR